MNVSLTPELEAFVDQAVESGRFGSASETVRAGLRLLQEREMKFAQLKAAIRQGLESGPSEAGNLDALKAEARERWERRQGASPDAAE